ncbi:hypothetical protein [Actinokineospora enzanensis]|uniref:hypothetical protein n=1 Tax=Actinokineospora enzanensis TaxID=155975 RepID=UPI000382A817|nr:hypothetical protein [Actinokineospora enzanensis]
MRTHVRTRGRGVDYTFVGTTPAPWWAEFGGLTSFEKPTLLVSSDATGWRVYASAIPTVRRDSSSTPIRLSLLLAGTHTDSLPDGVLPLIRGWLADSTPGAPQRLRELVDEEFPEPDVEELIISSGEPNDATVDDRVNRILTALAAKDTSDPPDPPRPGIWVGGIHDESARRAFVDLSACLLTGRTTGWAVQLTLAGIPEIADRFADEPGSTLALIRADLPEGPRELRPKGPPWRTPPLREKPPGSSRALALLALAAAATIIRHLTAHPRARPAPPASPSPSPNPAPSPGRTSSSPGAPTGRRPSGTSGRRTHPTGHRRERSASRGSRPLFGSLSIFW